VGHVACESKHEPETAARGTDVLGAMGAGTNTGAAVRGAVAMPAHAGLQLRAQFDSIHACDAPVHCPCDAHVGHVACESVPQVVAAGSGGMTTRVGTGRDGTTVAAGRTTSVGYAGKNVGVGVAMKEMIGGGAEKFGATVGLVVVMDGGDGLDGSVRRKACTFMVSWTPA
jgi:hypothetical protein